ncbi:MAG: hypothetical protein LUE27_01380 [Clostridia bacterium]|nr:hypothetical protein [Clostridia bacterium]
MTPLQSPYITPGMVFGTETERRLLDALGSPDDSLKIVHIAGTNGKGSTAIFLSSILHEAGKLVGTFTSPQIYVYEDMFQLDCRPADEDTLKAVMQEVISCMEQHDIHATQFEVETAAAILLFKEQGCEYAVLECGMGGTDDATNAVHKKKLAIITSISLEHTKFLGKTITEICDAKAGIIKDCPAIISADQTEEALEYFYPLWQEGNILMHNPVKIKNILDEEDGLKFKYNYTWYKTHAHGWTQAGNASLAVQAARKLGVHGEAIAKGLENAYIPGRIEVIRKGRREIILDGAHNPDAFDTLYIYLLGKEDIRIIYGCLSDKDADGCMEALSKLPAKISVVQPPSPRAMKEGKIYGICSKYFNDVTVYKTVTEALEASTEKTTAVCGTFTYLAEALKWTERRQ